MYICICIYIYIYTYPHTHTHTHAHTHAHAHAHTHIHISARFDRVTHAYTHWAHSSFPSATWNLPVGHATQCVDASCALSAWPNVPLAHNEHALWATAAANLPAGQSRQCDSDMRPVCALYRATGQLRQAVEPADVSYWPAMQSLQSASPVWS